MSTLIIRGESNTPGMKDYTGAFLPESTAFQQLHKEMQYYLETFDNRLPFAQRSKQFLKRLATLAAANVTFDTVAIFCHGWGDGIQAGFTRRNVKTLVAALIDAGLDTTQKDDATIILYCCSTGDDPDHDDTKSAPGVDVGEGSFADAFRDELCKAGHTECRVVAHTTAGHTTKNPYAIVFEGLGSPIGGVGGTMPVTLGQKQLWSTWVKLLKTSFRFEYPFMTVGMIHERILAEKSNV
jgi:hypothetical protein